MLKNFSETLKNTIQLITSLVQLAVLGGVIFGGLWVYHKTAELTSKPIQMPSVVLPEVKMPKIQIEAPEIKLPTIALPDVTLPQINLPEGGLFGKEEESDMEKFWKNGNRWPEKSSLPVAGWNFKP